MAGLVFSRSVAASLVAVAIFAAGLAAAPPQAIATTAPVSPTASRAEPILDRLPVQFEPNAGQAGEAVRFLARAGSVELGPSGVAFALGPGDDTVEMRFRGAGEARLRTVKISPSKLVAKGSNFTATVGVSFDLIDFSAGSTVKVKKKATKIIQKGGLANGMSIKDYLRSVGQNPVLVSFTNDNQAVTTLRFTP